jgi:hypothetical protein
MLGRRRKSAARVVVVVAAEQARTRHGTSGTRSAVMVLVLAGRMRKSTQAQGLEASVPKSVVVPFAPIAATTTEAKPNPTTETNRWSRQQYPDGIVRIWLHSERHAVASCAPSSHRGTYATIRLSQAVSGCPQSLQDDRASLVVRPDPWNAFEDPSHFCRVGHV